MKNKTRLDNAEKRASLWERRNTSMLSAEKIEKIVSRHVGRVLQRLDEIHTATIVKDCVKAEMWMISDDVKLELRESRAGAGNDEQKNLTR